MYTTVAAQNKKRIYTTSSDLHMV